MLVSECFCFPDHGDHVAMTRDHGDSNTFPCAEMLMDNCCVAKDTSAARAEPHLPRDTGGRVSREISSWGDFTFGFPEIHVRY